MRGRVPAKPVKIQSKKQEKSTTKSATTGNSNGAVGTTPKSTCRIKSCPTCVGCGANIGDSVRALQCDRCCDDSSWKCADCLGLSVDVYESLLLNAGELRWFCDPCNKHIANQSDSIAEKLDAISNAVDKLMNRLHSIETRLDSGIDSIPDSTITGKLDDMNTRLQAIETRLDTRADPTQSKLDDMNTRLQAIEVRLASKVDTTQSMSEGRELQIIEPVALAVQDALQQDKAEELEIEKRKTNVIVHSLAESQDDNSEHRISDDLAVLSAMFHEAGVQDAKAENVVRLGKRATDPIQNPRPMKVVLDSVDSKISLLKKAKNLRLDQEGEWSLIVIHQDLTPKQREARKPLVAELKQRMAQGKQDLVIFYGKVVKKRGARSSQMS